MNQQILDTAKSLLRHTIPRNILDRIMSEEETDITAEILVSYYRMLEAGAKYIPLYNALINIQARSGGDLNTQRNLVKQLEELGKAYMENQQ